MRKIICSSLLCIAIGTVVAFSQSRGIMTEYVGVFNSVSQNDKVFTTRTAAPIGYGHAYSSTFEIAGEVLVKNTPYIQLGNNYYSLLTKYNRQLCPIETKKIPIPLRSTSTNPLLNLAVNGTSKPDGGFALVTNSYPFYLRNYNNQGNLIFSKIISTPFYDNGGPGTFPSFYGDVCRPKLVANLTNNNLFVVFASNFNPYYPLETGEYNPTINVIEISQSGSVVNAFRMEVDYSQIYYDPLTSPDPLLHSFNIFGQDFIGDVKYVRGTGGSSGDRLWIGLNFEYYGSLEYNGNGNNYVQASYFGGSYYLSGVAEVDPLGTTGAVGVLLTSGPTNMSNPSDTQLTVLKNGSASPEILAFTVEGSKPSVYRFGNYTSPVPNNKYRFPLTISSNLFDSQFLDIKNHQKNLLFSVGKYFGIFDLGSMLIRIREQNPGNAPQLGNVDFISTDTNRLYIHYNNYNNPGVGIYNPMDFIIKEDIRFFDTTCWSHGLGTQTVLSTTPTLYPLTSNLLPLPGVVLGNDLSYNETLEPNAVEFKNICLNCSSVFKASQDLGTIEDNGMRLYPNPTIRFFSLDTELPIQEVTVYSLFGQMIKSFKEQTEYNVSDLPKGSYIIRVTTADGFTLTKTLIKE